MATSCNNRPSHSAVTRKLDETQGKQSYNGRLDAIRQCSSVRSVSFSAKIHNQSDFDKYEWIARTHTQWKQVAQNRFVPWQTNLYQKGVHREAQCEFRFRDWKFGKDVDLSLLEEESFQEGKIDASIDFFKIKEFFDLQSSK